MSLVVPCKLIALFGKLPIIFPGKWAIASKNSTAIAAKNTLVFGKMSALCHSALNDEKFKKQVEDIIIYRTTYEAGQAKNAPRLSCSGAIPGGRRLARCNPIPKPYPDSPRSTSQYTTLKEYLDNKDHNENRVFTAPMQ